MFSKLLAREANDPQLHQCLEPAHIQLLVDIVHTDIALYALYQ